MVAALEALTRLRTPARGALNDFVRRFWSKDLGFVLYRAAEALGVQADIKDGQAPDAPSPEQCIDTLRQAAMWTRTVRRQGRPVDLRTPAASAMAAAKAWALQPDRSWYRPAGGDTTLLFAVDQESTAWTVAQVARLEDTIAADVLAWRIGTSGLDQAVDLGLRLLPDRDEPDAMAIHDRNQLACGALMASLAAASGDEPGSKRIIERIESRMATRFGLITDPSLLATYRAALLILGREEHAPSVLQATRIGQLPSRRGLTALIAAGDRRGLDWLLIENRSDPPAVERLLLGEEFNEVLAALAPDLPLPWADLDTRIRQVQIQLLRRVWVASRDSGRWRR